MDHFNLNSVNPYNNPELRFCKKLSDCCEKASINYTEMKIKGFLNSRVKYQFNADVVMQPPQSEINIVENTKDPPNNTEKNILDNTNNKNMKIQSNQKENNTNIITSENADSLASNLKKLTENNVFLDNNPYKLLNEMASSINNTSKINNSSILAEICEKQKDLKSTTNPQIASSISLINNKEIMNFNPNDPNRNINANINDFNNLLPFINNNLNNLSDPYNINNFNFINPYLDNNKISNSNNSSSNLQNQLFNNLSYFNNMLLQSQNVCNLDKGLFIKGKIFFMNKLIQILF